jgi:hypothetical protein
LAVANKFTGKPILFIAVNSGNDPASVRNYIRSNKVTWPVIIDSDRAFESRADVKEVSLKNIWQFRSIDAKGNMDSFNGTKMAETAAQLLGDAKWEVDASLIPKPLSQAHYLVEFGSYSAAAKTLNEASQSRDETIKAGADALLTLVKRQIQVKLDAAKEAQTNSQVWSAYKLYSAVGDQFKGYELDVDLRSILKELKSTDAVKAELSAMRLFESAKKQFARNGMKRTLVKLNRIVDKYPDTEAATMAREVIDAQ